MTVKPDKPAVFISWGLLIALFIGAGLAAYLVFYPGAVFVFVALLEFILLAGAVSVFFLRRRRGRWWVP
ncbi:MAG: hypothetical protein NT177_08660, partial [Chloroflexi bacterium]|nr:hypothetical protein [Chloroflexota bacterium]